jgi:hypothetical protein
MTGELPPKPGRIGVFVAGLLYNPATRCVCLLIMFQYCMWGKNPHY